MHIPPVADALKNRPGARLPLAGRRTASAGTIEAEQVQITGFEILLGEARVSSSVNEEPASHLVRPKEWRTVTGIAQVKAGKPWMVGHPTVEVDALLVNGMRGRASTPSGVTISPDEAVERRDGIRTRYNGRGVLDAVSFVNGEIGNALRGIDARLQSAIDHALIALDGTSNKSRSGANATLGASMAVAHAAAAAQGEPLCRYLGGQPAAVLPIPLMNLLIGGVHAEDGLPFREIHDRPGWCPELRRSGEDRCRGFPRSAYGTTHGRSSDDGGRRRRIRSRSRLDRGDLTMLAQAVERAGHTPGKDVAPALDVAASEFFRDGIYSYEGKRHSTESHVAHLTPTTIHSSAGSNQASGILH